MNILIFKTANDKKMYTLLDQLAWDEHKVFLVLSHADEDAYKSKYEKLSTISTEKTYIEYSTILQEKKIPDLLYDEIWVPSSFESNYYGFGEVYAIISRLKYGALVWISGSGRRVIVQNTVGYRCKERLEAFLVKAVYITERVVERFSIRIRGCKW